MSTRLFGRCNVCHHRRLAEIEEANLIRQSDYEVGKRFGVGRKSVENHRKQHLPQRLMDDAATAGGLDPDGEPNLYAKLLKQRETLGRVARKAEKERQYPSVISALKAQREIDETIAKARGELPAPPSREGDTTVNIAVGDADTAERIARAVLERRGVPALTAAVDTEEVSEEEEAIDA